MDFTEMINLIFKHFAKCGLISVFNAINIMLTGSKIFKSVIGLEQT